MRLKKLELYGFKSFAARTEIIFGDGITGIVGPNGSGKSNIGDAVRWVLGEQSAKTLRGGSMSDVIFNGTQTRKPLSYCEVSLVFNNDDRSLPMDFAEIMVTRRIYRNGESEYFLNQSSCRLKDIIDLFRDTGIGKEGYSIIGQGRIDEILSRKSEDRRQVFEEAAGIVKFKARKEEADRKLEHTLQNAERLDDIIEELSNRLGPLEEQSKSARQYLEWSEELKVLDLNLFIIRSDRFENRITELKENIGNITVVIETTQNHLNEQNTKRDQLQKMIEEMNQIIDEQRKHLSDVTEKVYQLNQSISMIHTRKETRAEHKNQLNQELKEADQKLEKLETLHNQSEEQILLKKKELEEALNHFNQLETLEKTTKREEQEESEYLDSLKQSVIDAINRASASLNDQTRLNTMKSQMEQRLEELRVNLEELHKKETESQNLVSLCKDQLHKENDLYASIQTNLHKTQEEFQLADQELILIRSKAEKKSSEMQSIQSRYHLLKEMSQEMEGYNQSVRRSIQYAKDQHIDGVHGVLATLISVPQNLEVAIDMALGGALQNIITDREEIAKQIIEYLRNNRLGRATFLPISSIRSKTLNESEKKLLSMPGCIGVASELITYKDIYRPILENLLGRTIISDNLDHGIAIMRAGHHAFRLVTLEGDVIHSGGSMTGGSVQSKMTNLLGREREINNLESTLKQGKEDFDQLKSELEHKQNQKNDLRRQITEFENQSHQQEISIAREQDHLQQAELNLSENHQQIEDTQLAVYQLNESIHDIDDQLELLFNNKNQETIDQEAIEEEIRIKQDALIQKRQSIEKIEKEVTESRLHVSDLHHDLDIMNHNSDHYMIEKNNILQSNLQKAEMIHKIEQSDNDDLQQIESLKVTLHLQQKKQNEIQTVLQNHENNLHTKQMDLNHILSNIEELHTSSIRDSETLHKYDLALSRIENDLKVLQDKIWSSYELTYGGALEYKIEDSFSESTADKRVKELSLQIRSLGNINVSAIEEYISTKERYDELTTQQNDLKKAEEDIRALIQELLEQMEKTFVTNFTLLQKFFSETFVRLFGGGHAEIELTDPDDPLNCGIEVNVQPPGKKLQLLSLLSGGEKALTAIAILFAMLKLKPTPFCILDEIEAALDDANIGYYADYLKEYSKETQFIVVTHRKGTMERCNSLFGVAMEEQGVSKMVSVSLHDYQEEI